MYSTKGEQYVEKLEENYKNINPKIAEKYGELSLLSKKKLWHQLTNTLSDFVLDTHFIEKPAELIDLYNHFIVDFDYKLNSLKLAHILMEVSQKFSNSTEAINFLEQKLKRFSEENGKALLRVTIAALHISNGEALKAKEILDEVGVAIEKIDSLEAPVYAKYYQVFSEYHKRQGNVSQYYHQQLLYLAYVQLETLSTEDRKTLSRDLIISALVSDDVYSFGEIVSQPILSSLKDSDHSWLLEFITAFNRGDIRGYQKLLETHRDKFSKQKEFATSTQLLSEKIAILALIELIFSRSSQNRTIPFRDISQATFLKLEDVELLVMRALSVGLIKGEIDEVSQVVIVEWVQPRVLSLDQVATLRDKVEEWKGHVKKTLSGVEEQTQELFY